MRYVIRKFAQTMFVVVVVTFVTAVALRFLPGGNDVVVGLKAGPGATPEQAKAVIHELGLDKSIPSQYFTWVKHFVSGDWGLSFHTNQRIAAELKRAVPVSVYLMIYAQLLALGLAIPTAVWSAYRQNSRFDRLATTTAFGMLSVPNFIVAPVLVLLFCVQRKWIPFPSTYHSLWESPIDHFKAFVLPTVTIAIPLYAGYMRVLRADMIGTLQSDFITTARAKGVGTPALLFKHALRPSLFSIVTSAAVQIGALMGGVVIVESFFGLNGMGSLTVESIFTHEYPTVQFCVVILALIYVFTNFLVDLAYAWIDPRVRVSRTLS
ncbi:MAG: ABC transporter permease [Actinomycetota bacterium]